MIGTTITKFLVEEQRRFPSATGDLTSVINDIVTACKTIAAALRYGALSVEEVLGISGTDNSQGDAQKNLDVIANRLFLQCTEAGGHVAALASEEMESIHQLPGDEPKGRYLLLYDPVDGSFSINENASIGTIFSILKRQDDATGRPELTEFLQPGANQVCAGYAIYGPSCMMVMTTGNGTNGFTLDPLVGEFILTHPGMSIRRSSARFSANVGWIDEWRGPLRQYARDRIDGSGVFKDVELDYRWSRCMVTDVHRILMSGGVWASSANNELRSRGHEGVMRMLYEINPMAFVVEQAGGLAYSADRRAMEIEIETLHQRGSVILGSQNDVELFLREYS